MSQGFIKHSHQVYQNAFVPQIERILGQINQNVGSTAYGSCDRHYWHNTTVGFSNARYQEAVLTLALIYLHGPSPWQGNAQILRLINGCIDFWMSIQEEDGSFNEWYIHEGSYVATAFTTYAISETLLLLGRSKIVNYDRAVKSLALSSDWLKTRSQKSVCNQQTGALVELYNTYLLTKQEQYLKAAKTYEELIASCQKPEGWFMEYGGVDVGYLSLTIDYLAKYLEKNDSPLISAVIDKAIGFITQCVHPDGTSGGSYTSRETEYLMPHGFELRARRGSKEAAYVAWHVRNNLAFHKGVSLPSLDDRYLMYVGYTFIQAFIDGDVELAYQEIAHKPWTYFKDAGLLIARRKNFSIWANVKKTGALAAIGDNGKRLIDSGVLVKSGKMYFSGYVQEDVRIKTLNENEFIVESNLRLLKEQRMSPVKLIVLNLMQISVGRFRGVNAAIKDYLRKLLIVGHKPSPISLERHVRFNEDAVHIEDRIKGLSAFDYIAAGAMWSFIYVPSCRWFQKENARNEDMKIYSNKDCALINGTVVLKRTIAF